MKRPIHRENTVCPTIMATPEAIEKHNKAMKFDGDKVRQELLMQGCPNAIEGVSKVLTFGAAKYAAHSWKQLENNVERYTGALYRHMNAIDRGEEVDPESGLPHIYHVACNAMFLAELYSVNKTDA